MDQTHSRLLRLLDYDNGPGRIETDMIAGRMAVSEEKWLSETPVGGVGAPEEVAQAVVFLASQTQATSPAPS